MGNKVCLILPCNIYVTPFYYRYEKILKDMSIDFDLIIWNREKVNEISDGNIIYYNLKDESNNGNKFKIIKFIRFAFFVKKRIKNSRYEKLIFLGSYAGTAAILSNFLSKYYEKKYWFDIRDYTYEWFKPYYLFISKAIKNSYKTTISSKGYKQFLPEYDYAFSHNMNISMIEECRKKLSHEKKNNNIRISFIGNIRYYDENIKLLNALKNDMRFILQYYGDKSEYLESYCKENNIKNVDFHGKFDTKDTPDFYAKTDIINNVYGNSGIELTTALSNKLYFAIGLNIPILVSRDTYMDEVCKKCKLGFTVDFKNSNLANDLYDWYMNFNKEESNRYCSKYWNLILEEDLAFDKNIKMFLK